MLCMQCQSTNAADAACSPVHVEERLTTALNTSGKMLCQRKRMDSRRKRAALGRGFCAIVAPDRAYSANGIASRRPVNHSGHAACASRQPPSTVKATRIAVAPR